MGRLRAVLEVNEQDLKRLVSGQPVDVQVTALGIRIATQIDSVSTVPISEVGQGRTKPKYEVWCPLPEPDGRIVIGMRVEGTIQAAR